MSNTDRRLDALTPQQRRQLMLQLQKKKMAQTAVAQIQPRQREGNRLPLSFAQQRLWFLQQLEPQSNFYNMNSALRLTGQVHIHLLEQCLNRIIQRHEVLRTTFQEQDEAPVQVIAAEHFVQIPLCDLSGLPMNEREKSMRRLFREVIQLPFDLSRGPLLRAYVFCLNEQEHVLLLTIHHIISDAWSLNILVRELSTLYQTEASGQSSALPALSIQYADYVFWQRERLQGEILQKQLDYWRQQLTDAPALLNLPLDHARPSVQSYAGTRLDYLLPVTLQQELKRLSQQEGVTLFMTLLAAFQVLLMRHTGQEDVVVGSPIANRGRAELEQLIGLFVNLLALRTDLAGNPTFKVLLARVREVVLQAFAHQDMPFERLVEELHIERSPGHAPLFQVHFALQNIPQTEIKLNALTIQPVELEQNVTRFDLSMVLYESEQGLWTVLEYNTDLFEDGTIQRLLERWRVLLEGIVAYPQTVLADLPLLTEDERRTLLTNWAEITPEDVEDQNLARLFEAQVTATPDAVAITFEQQQLTYSELNRRANQFSFVLRHRGVGPDCLVGIFMDRSLEMVIALLGTLKAGGAYVPLDITAPLERLRWICEDIQPILVLSQSHLQPTTLFPGMQVLSLDTAWESNAQYPANNPEDTVSGDNLAYVLYTSGSSGQPKGVMMSHAGICNSLHWLQETYQLTSYDSVLQKTSSVFDPSVKEIFWPLLNGARLVLALPDGQRDSSYILAVTVLENVTAQIFIPSLLWVALAEPGWEHCRHLRLVMSGGEALNSELQAHFFARHGAILWNLYGPTETAVQVSGWQCDQKQQKGIVPIGFPIRNTRIYLLDTYGALVPIGVSGEIYIGGLNLARGYLARPMLTAERFVPDPFSQEAGARLYRTGDLARYRADGALEYLGRLDHQVKVRGVRIELEELEAVLRAHPAIQEAVVLVRQETESNKQLVAYITIATAEQPTVETLRAYMGEYLPDYMAPTQFVVLDTLPLTTNGKVDRRVLARSMPIEGVKGEVVAPQNAIESILVDIWKELLDQKRVSIEDNFFELGGHSLLAAQMFARVRHTLQVDIPLRTLFSAPTIVELALQIEQFMKDARKTHLPALVALPRLDELPLSFAQERLWFLQQLYPLSTAYNTATALRLTGPLSVRALIYGLTKVVQRHESLRTLFGTYDNRPIQIIVPAQPVQIPVVDLSALLSIVREQAARSLMHQEAQRPFDLATGPLLRAYLLRMNQQEHILLFTMHHIVADGWSANVLVQELTGFYQEELSGQAAPLQNLPIQYADYALWQRQWLQGEILQEQVDYWTKQLDGAPALLELPTDNPRPPAQSFRGARLHYLFPHALQQELQRLSKQEGVTLFMTLLASFQVLLLRYSGQEDIVVGTPIANRSRTELEPLIGLFINMLALRTDLSGNPTFKELLGRVREVTLQAYAHQDLPFERLVDLLHVKRSLNHEPLFQVLLSLQNVPQSDAVLEELVIQPFELELISSRLDLCLGLQESENGLQIVAEYSTDLFEARTIRRLLTHWQTLLEAILHDSNQPVAVLPLLPKAEQQILLEEWNRTSVKHPSEKGLCVLFEEQVVRTPDAIAVVYAEQMLTYQQLNEQANQFALFIQRRGDRVEMLVGVYHEPSLSLPVVLLGILKAGAAYLPLDPTYPAERLAFMLSDAQPDLVVIQHSHMVASANFLPATMPVLYLDDPALNWSLAPAANPAHSVGMEQLAYVIYTSGSTGQPKGTMISQRGVCNSLLWMQNSYQLTVQDCVIQKTSLSFDPSVWELFWPLINGARLLLCSLEVRKDTTSLLALMREQAVTTLNFSPTSLRVTLDEPGWRQCEHIRLVMCGGEAMPYDLPRRFYAHSPVDARLFNLYGPTEATIEATAWTCKAQVDMVAQRAIVPLGRPISNVELYLLDKYAQPVPIGIPGEVYIGGTGLARGYLGRADLTAQRFVPHHLGSIPGARLYRTGDIARYRADGVLEYIGRNDQQVKIRGFRIELGEIEAVLQRHETVQQVCVVVQKQSQEEQRLIAYIIPHPVSGDSGEQPREIGPVDSHMSKELRHFALKWLPEHMVPALFVLLPQMPILSNGKIDRQALVLMEAGPVVVEREVVAPYSPVEELLVVIWMSLLNVPQIGIHDDFFEIGGHSLLATQLIARMRQLMQIELPLPILFEAPTIAALAQKIEQLMLLDQAHASPPIQRGGRDIALPLSFAQERLWFLQQLEPESTAYHIPTVLRVTGPFSIASLDRALAAIVQRHEVLRTTFSEQGGQPTQIIWPALTIPEPVVDLCDLTLEQREKQVEQLALQEAMRPFDLTRRPPLRGFLLRLGEQEHVLLFTMHHIVSDAWSIGVLVRELSELYTAYSRGKTPQLPDLPIQYADYALWQREWLQGAVLQEQLGYWQQKLAHSPAELALPLDHPRQNTQTREGTAQSIMIPYSVLQELKQLGQREGTTLYMTLLAALKVLLMRYSGQKDIIVGSSIANRTHGEVEGLLGVFLNLVVLRTDLSHNPSFRELLARVRETALQAFVHQEVPFEKIVESLHIERSLSISPLFQVLFVLQNTPRTELDLDGSSWKVHTVEHTTAKYDLSLEVEETEQGLFSLVKYNTNLFEAATIQRLLNHWQMLLVEIVRDSNQAIENIPLLSPEERSRLLSWSMTSQQEQLETQLPQRFEYQVEQTPDAIAMVNDTEQMTYACLNQQANRLAHYLQQQGVGPEVHVGLYLEKGPLALVALLAVLKAGGAYVFLDPSLPEARLIYMVGDARPQLVLTQTLLYASLQTRMRDYTGKLLCYEQFWQVVQEQPVTNLAVPLAASNLAYIVYTSGSTGRPKGVQSTYGSVINYLTALTQLYRLHAAITVLQIPPFSFDASVRDIFGTLLAGGRLVLTGQQDTGDLGAVLKLLKQQGVTHLLSIVPSLLRTVLDAAESLHESFNSVQLILTSGERLPLAEVAQVRRIFSERVEVVNQYGPTEATMTTTYYSLPYQMKLDEQETKYALSGHPIPTMQVYLLDSQYNLTPQGVVGEVYLGGPGLARGYMGRSDETADKFLPHPFSRVPGERLYRTGDRARYKADGALEYLGRIDQQAKIRGNRVEPGEIEWLLELYVGIKQCIALVREDHSGEPQLIAYLLIEPGQTMPEPETLRRYLRIHVPDYMLPTYFIELEVVPLTTNGKIDRLALPAPDGQLAGTNTAFVEPATRLQQRLAVIWMDLLHCPSVGIHDNFFHLGGHSLLATLLLMRIRSTFEADIPLRSLFEGPTLAQMANSIEQIQIEQMQVRLAEQEDDEAMERTLALLEAMPDDEIRSL